MNWRKSKNRLIILFLSINVLLGWANYRKDTTAYVLRETQLQDINTVLKANNIFVDTAIPKEYKPLPKLTVFPFQLDSGMREDFVKSLLETLDGVKVSIEAARSPDEKPRRIYRRTQESVTFEGENILYHHEGNMAVLGGSEPLDINKAQEIAKQCLVQMGYSPRKMHKQIVEEAQGLHIIYYDKYDGIPVFDSYVKIRVTPLGIGEIEIHKVELGEATGGKQEIYSADQVFFYLMNLLKADEPTHIKDIMVGYALENPKGTHLIAEKALPFYQVILEDGRTFYINAYTSEIRQEPQI